MNQNLFRKYSETIVRVGINLKEGERVFIKGSTECLSLMRELTEICWAMGAQDVITKITDRYIERSFYDFARDEALDEYMDFKVSYTESMYKEKYHIISITCPNLDFMSNVDSDKMHRANMAANAKTKHLDKYMDKGDIKWVVAACATQRWADLLFPDMDEDKAIDELWNHIFKAARIDENDESNLCWKKHDAILKEKEAWLDSQDFEFLHYEGPGTDLKVYLAEKSKWVGGSSITPEGVSYMANIPTEEIFTAPHMYKVDGRLKATKPLALAGKIVEDFSFVFKDGKVIEFEAKENGDILEKYMESDENAVRLGEIALVPDASPISDMNILFRNTLFDENASCHFALGASYAENIIGGELMSAEERTKLGANDSVIHIDFMVGGPELKVTGYKKDGTTVPVLINGNWCK